MIGCWCALIVVGRGRTVRWCLQVQRAGAGRADGRAGDCVGVGHVGEVCDELGRGWKCGGGADGRRVRWVDDGDILTRCLGNVEHG